MRIGPLHRQEKAVVGVVNAIVAAVAPLCLVLVANVDNLLVHVPADKIQEDALFAK